MGSGKARNWNDLAKALFVAMNKGEKIEYIDMPTEIKDQYQFHTCSETEKIQKAGFAETILSLEEGVADYVEQYLIPERHLS